MTCGPCSATRTGSDQTILAGLHALDEAPWGDWYGKPLNPRDLAKLLRPYEIKSRFVRRPGRTAAKATTARTCGTCGSDTRRTPSAYLAYQAYPS